MACGQEVPQPCERNEGTAGRETFLEPGSRTHCPHLRQRPGDCTLTFLFLLSFNFNPKSPVGQTHPDASLGNALWGIMPSGVI